MKELNTIQKRYNLNEVCRKNEPSADGAYHTYMIQRRVYPVGEAEKVIPIAEIVFQRGPRNEDGSTTGVLDADLLEIVRDRLKGFQTGEYATMENDCAIRHIEEALMWMNKRVEDRAERGVLGTMQK